MNVILILLVIMLFAIMITIFRTLKDIERRNQETIDKFAAYLEELTEDLYDD